jgi:hypothetical protein
VDRFPRGLAGSTGTLQQRNVMSDDLRTTDSGAHAPPAVISLAKKIVRAQGCEGVLARETSGYHLYIPCPDCLATHGRRELNDPKYSINLSLAAGTEERYQVDAIYGSLGAAMQDRMEERRDRSSSVCMRTRSSMKPHRFSLRDLLQMATITERHPDLHTQAAIHGGTGSADREKMWVEDPLTGKLCPPPPGETVSLTQLPLGHPAVRYIAERGYSVLGLDYQMRAAFCTRQHPEGDERKIFYRKMPGGWKDTPQHRVVFYSLLDGAPMSWQARVIERVMDEPDGSQTRRMLHPYAGGFFASTDVAKVEASVRADFPDLRLETALTDDGKGCWCHGWNVTHFRPNQAAQWMPVAPFDETKEDGTPKFLPSKYRTAKYSSRVLMGWDAAVDNAERAAGTASYAVLCEGPLDAARFGPGGLAVLGSSLSETELERLVRKFRVVMLAFDDDKAGRDALRKIQGQLEHAKFAGQQMDFVVPLPLPPGQDPGDLTKDAANEIVARAWKMLRRQM